MERNSSRFGTRSRRGPPDSYITDRWAISGTHLFELGFCLSLAVAPPPSSTPFRAPACTGDRESRSPEPSALVILHRERANKVFGKRSARLLASSSPWLAFRLGLPTKGRVVSNADYSAPSTTLSSSLQRRLSSPTHRRPTQRLQIRALGTCCGLRTNLQSCFVRSWLCCCCCFLVCYICSC